MPKQLLFAFLIEIILFTAFSQGDVDVNQAPPLSKGFQITGGVAQDILGNSVSSAGDVNGDGIADIIIGAKQADAPGGRGDAGIVYVIYGKQNGFSAHIDFSVDLPLSEGFKVFGSAAGDHLGYSVSSAGDVNKDGVGDIIVGAREADGSGGRTDSGKAYVIYGKIGGLTANIDLINTLPLSQGFEITPPSANQAFGVTVSSAGDFNKDGIDDVIIGAEATTSPNGANAGVVYVIYGKQNDRTAHIDLSNSLPVTEGIKIFGAISGGKLGSVSSAGDVNNDGINDVIVGGLFINGQNPYRYRAGGAYVIYGKANGYTSDINLASLVLADGFKIVGPAASNYLGFSVSSAGDVNRDGFADVIVGCHGCDFTSRNDAGAAYVIYGKRTDLAVDIDLKDPLPIGQGFTIIGSATSNLLGVSVSSAGDVNHDGASDVIVGARCEAGTTQTLAGVAYVIYGKEGGMTGDVDLMNPLDVSQGFQITGGNANNKLGFSVKSAGDINDDGVDDVITGAIYDSRSGRTNSGTAFVIYSPFCYVDHCTSCTGRTCLTCADNYRLYLGDNKCYFKGSCPSGTLPDSTHCLDTRVNCQTARCQTCSDNYRLYLGDSKCYYKESCPSGTSPNATHCVDATLASVAIVQGTASQVAGVMSSSVTLINFNNPGGLLFAALGETLKYMKYMKIRYPPKLQYILDQPEPELYSIPYFTSVPDKIEEEIISHSLGENFDNYDLNSSFLINFWNPLLMLLIIILVIIIVCFGSYISTDFAPVNFVCNQIKEIVKWNYLLGTFTGSFGPIAFYSSFEFRTTQLESGLSRLSFAVCIIMNLITFSISMRILFIIKKLSQEKDSHKLKKLKQDFKEYKTTFEEFKGTSLLQQNCFLISCLRLYLFYAILGYLFEYPMFQAILFNIQSLSFLLYLLIKRPFKGILELVEAVILELILLVVHVGVLGLAILQEIEPEITEQSVSLGEIVVVCSSVFSGVQCLYLVIQVLILARDLFRYIKRKFAQNETSLKREVPDKQIKKPVVKLAGNAGSTDQSVINESHDLIIIPSPSRRERSKIPIRYQVEDVEYPIQKPSDFMKEDIILKNNMRIKSIGMRGLASSDNSGGLSPFLLARAKNSYQKQQMTGSNESNNMRRDKR